MKFANYNLISLVFGGLQTALVILFVVGFNQHLLGLVGALLIAEAIQLGFTIISSRKLIKLLLNVHKKEKVQFTKVIGFLKNSLIFIPSTLSFWLLMNLDQWMLGAMIGLEFVGLYAFAGKFSILFDYLLSSSLMLVYTPWFYNRLRKNFVNAGRLNAVFSVIIIILSFVICWTGSHLTFLLKPIISENYYDSLKFIPPLMLIACIRLAAQVLLLTVKYSNKISCIVSLNIFAAVMNSILNYFWIPNYGIRGCIMATFCSFLTMFLITLLIHRTLVKSESLRLEVRHAC